METAELFLSPNHSMHSRANVSFACVFQNLVQCMHDDNKMFNIFLIMLLPIVMIRSTAIQLTVCAAGMVQYW